MERERGIRKKGGKEGMNKRRGEEEKKNRGRSEGRRRREEVQRQGVEWVRCVSPGVVTAVGTDLHEEDQESYSGRL